MEAKDPVTIRVVLTLLSSFRIMPAEPKLKLETITAPFSGNYKTSPEINLACEKLERFVPKINLKNYRDYNLLSQVGKNHIPTRSRIIPLTSSGPNSLSQVFGFRLDALALSRNPTILEAFKVVSHYLAKDI